MMETDNLTKIEEPEDDDSSRKKPDEGQVMYGDGDDDDDDDEKTKIEKGVRFWNHPSLRDVPSEQKRLYLYEKGLTDAQVHKVWEQIVEQGFEDGSQRGSVSNDFVRPSSTGIAPEQRMSSRVPAPKSFNGPSPALHSNNNPYHANPSTMNSSMYQPYSSPPLPYNNATSNYTGNNYAACNTTNNLRDEDEGPMPFLQGLSLVTLGGFIGLTAAAASRWLNGGDFQLFPPPIYPSETQERASILRQPQNSNVNRDKNDNDNDDEAEDEEQADYVDSHPNTNVDYDDSEGILVPEVQEKMLQQIEILSETIKSHVTVQEKILQKISNINKSSLITDQSMNLLRSSSSVQDNEKRNFDIVNSNNKDALPKVWMQLVEIKAEMRTLQHQRTQANGTSNGDHHSWEIQMIETLKRLEACIEQLQSSMNFLINWKSKTIDAGPRTTTSTTATSSSRSCGIQIPIHPAPATTPLDITATTTSTAMTIDDSKCPETPLERQKVFTLRQSIRRLAEENEPTPLRVGAQLLYLYLTNLLGNPDNPRYRKIFTCNDSFQKVERLVGGKDVLLAVGFEEADGCLSWLPNNNDYDADGSSKEAEIEAMVKLKEATAALGMLKSGNQSTDLTESALAVLSPHSDVKLQPSQKE